MIVFTDRYDLIDLYNQLSFFVARRYHRQGSLSIASACHHDALCLPVTPPTPGNIAADVRISCPLLLSSASLK